MKTLLTTTLLCNLAFAPAAFAAATIDSDGDGVQDSADAYPCDNTLSGFAYAVAGDRSGTLLFEDEWPKAGDQDFNDLVVDWHFQVLTNASGHAVRLIGYLDVIALGGDYQIGMGLGLPVAKSRVLRASMDLNGQVSELLPSAADASFVGQISTDLRASLGLPLGPSNVASNGATAPASRIKVDIDFVDGTILDFGAAPFDLFTVRTGVEAGPGHEIHRPEYAGTAAMDTALFGTADDGSSPSRHFVDRQGLPFVLIASEVINYPQEGTHISAVYPDITLFAASGGATNQQWWTSNRDYSFAFLPRPVAPALSGVPAADTSCAATCTVTNTGYNVYAGTGVVSHNYVTEQECVDLGTAAGATIIQYSGTGNYPVCFYGPDTIQDRQCSRYGCGCGTGNCWPNTQQYRCSYGN